MRVISGYNNGEYVLGQVVKTEKNKLILKPGFILRRQKDGHYNFEPISEIEGILECQASALEMSVLDFLASNVQRLDSNQKKTRALYDLHEQGFDVILIDQETRTITPYQK